MPSRSARHQSACVLAALVAAGGPALAGLVLVVGNRLAQQQPAQGGHCGKRVVADVG